MYPMNVLISRMLVKVENIYNVLNSEWEVYLKKKEYIVLSKNLHPSIKYLSST